MGIVLASWHAIFPERCKNARHWDLCIFSLSSLRFTCILAEDSSDGEFTLCQSGHECSVSAHLPLFKGGAAGAQSGLGNCRAPSKRGGSKIGCRQLPRDQLSTFIPTMRSLPQG